MSERDEMVEGEIARIAAVDAAVPVAGVDAAALCSAVPEACLLRRLVVADVVRREPNAAALAPLGVAALSSSDEAA